MRGRCFFPSYHHAKKTFLTWLFSSSSLISHSFHSSHQKVIPRAEEVTALNKKKFEDEEDLDEMRPKKGPKENQKEEGMKELHQVSSTVTVRPTTGRRIRASRRKNKGGMRIVITRQTMRPRETLDRRLEEER